MFQRREFLATGGMVAVTPAFAAESETKPLYGLIGQIKCVTGKRAEVIGILSEGTAAMAGCRSYIIAEDSTDANAIWITEVWDSKQAHAASLKLPAVRAAIAKGRPLIAGFGQRFETVPRAGVR